MLELVKHPDEILLKELAYIHEPPDEETISDMIRVMRNHRGVGLAASQVGINEAFFIANFSGGLTVCINPEILRHGKRQIELPEGCLSIRDERDQMPFKPKKRWEIIDVCYTNMTGCKIWETLKRMDARIFQHEMDHLEGRLCQEI